LSRRSLEGLPNQPAKQTSGLRELNPGHSQANRKENTTASQPVPLGWQCQGLKKPYRFIFNSTFIANDEHEHQQYINMLQRTQVP